MKGRAKTTEAKRAVVERIFQSWLAAPALRLGQLLVTVCERQTPPLSLFAIEDERLAKMVHETAGDPVPHDLTPSEVALAKVLAAYDEWNPDGPDCGMEDIGEVLWRAKHTTNAGALTAPSRALVDRARKAGVL